MISPTTGISQSPDDEKNLPLNDKSSASAAPYLLSNEEQAIHDKTKALVEPYYKSAQDVAKNKDDELLRKFTDHGLNHHTMEVEKKSLQAADAISKSRNVDIDRNELIVASLFHDSGMDGGKLAESMAGNDVRKKHSLNSAIHVLENADMIESLGVNPNLVAFDCFAHSKSASQIPDLTNKDNWLKCFDLLESEVDTYNAANPNNMISFDRSAFGREIEENGKTLFEFDPNQFEKSQATVYALRIGDANDPRNINTSQSGEEISIESDGKVTIGDIVLNNDTDEGHHSRAAHIGEANISEMECLYNEKSGNIEEKISIQNGMGDPFYTLNAIAERIGELESGNCSYDLSLHFEGDYSPDEIGLIQEFYEKNIVDIQNTRNKQASMNLHILFPNNSK